MMKKYLSTALLLCFTNGAHAALVNGDFSSGASGWNDQSDRGSFSIVNGQGILETGSGTQGASAMVTYGDDGSFTFSSPIILSSDISSLFIDIKLERTSPSAEETEAVAAAAAIGETVPTDPDSLTIRWIDSDQFHYNLDITATTSFNPSTNMLTYVFNVSSIAGRTGALRLEFNDNADGYDSRVTFDNLRFAAAAVPVPPAGWLFGSAIMALVTVNKRRKLQNNSTRTILLTS